MSVSSQEGFERSAVDSTDGGAQSPHDDGALIAAQLGRMPRAPWRVGARCAQGAPTVIVSPSILEGGARFPNLGYLCCPHLVQAIGALESAGACAVWTERIAHEPELREALVRLDAAVRAERLAECQRNAQMTDACAEVGLAGQRDMLKVKCLHIHAAYALCGFDDPVGSAVLEACAPCERGASCGLLPLI